MLQACISSAALAQSELDKYLTGSNTFKVIGNASSNLTAPHDLDFVPERPGELWVLNKELNGGSVVIFFDAGKPTQFSQFRRDSHNDHFMANAVAIAMGNNGTFCSAQEIKNTSSPTSTFMGPALWSSDTSIFARINQNNWVTGQPLGSHLDMLHQSPFGMGVVHDTGNVYWYFDGHNGNICKYHFATPHVIGGDDHSDGRIYRYTDVTVTRKPNMPSHLALDKQNNWLYIVDGGSGKIMRLKTNSGVKGSSLTVPVTAGEPLAVYESVINTTTETIVASGLTSPCGIDYRSGRIVVSDNADGKLYIYDVTTTPATLKGSISTGAPGVMGVKIDNDNRIWFVNRTTKEVIRLENSNVLGVKETVVSDLSFSVYPNPATKTISLNLNSQAKEPFAVTMSDMNGRIVYSGSTSELVHTIDVSHYTKGIYQIVVSGKDGAAIQRLAIQ
ncbi:MAG: T9SS type A sorting domain-containing protein [Flavipsychrobacter sp.]|nr:T9SS type A sorting domain-containing protein [Flavipsychrobacter sp.]